MFVGHECEPCKNGWRDCDVFWRPRSKPSCWRLLWYIIRQRDIYAVLTASHTAYSVQLQVFFYKVTPGWAGSSEDNWKSFMSVVLLCGIFLPSQTSQSSNGNLEHSTNLQQSYIGFPILDLPNGWTEGGILHYLCRLCDASTECSFNNQCFKRDAHP